MTRTNKSKNRGRPKKSLQLAKTANIGPVVTKLCGVRDVFCKHSNGMQSPYGTSANTVSFTHRSTFSLSTQAGGVANILIRNSASSFNVLRSAPATPIWVTTSSYTDQIAFPTGIAEIRVVASGVRWWPIFPDSVSGGVLTILPLPDDKVLMDGAAHTLAQIQASEGARFTSLKDKGAYIFSPLEDASTFDSTSIAVAPIANYWDGVGLFIQGSTTTNYLQFELVTIYEATVDLSTLNFGRASKEFDLGVKFQKDSGSGGYIAGSLEQVSKYIKDRAVSFAKKAFNYGATKAITAGANYLLPGSGYAAAGAYQYAMIEDVD